MEPISKVPRKPWKPIVWSPSLKSVPIYLNGTIEFKKQTSFQCYIECIIFIGHPYDRVRSRLRFSHGVLSPALGFVVGPRAVVRSALEHGHENRIEDQRMVKVFYDCGVEGHC